MNRLLSTTAASMMLAAACSSATGQFSIDEEASDADTQLDPLPDEDANAQNPNPNVDAGSDRDADPLRTCTDEGWCHTVVPDAQTLKDVWGDGQGVVWTVSEEGQILRFDGESWVVSHTAGVPLYAIWGSSPTDIWAGGGARTTTTVLPGLLLHGTGDSPSTLVWTEVETPVTVRSIWGTSATDIWAAVSMVNRVRDTDPSYILHYTGPADPSEGTGWEIDPASTAFPAHFEKIWGTGTDDVWVSGRVAITTSTARGQALHRRPDGAGDFVWTTEQPPLPTNTLARTDTYGHSGSKTVAYLVGFNGNTNSAFLHVGVSADDGATFTWTEHTAAETGYANGSISAVWGTGLNDIWLAGARGRLRHWNGTTWRVALVSIDGEMPVQKAVSSFWGTGPNELWVVGADLAIHKVAQ
jgi:hypothetical protein